MAIFHLSHKAISRGQGQSIVAAAAYQSRGRIRDERSGQVKDYTRKAEQELLFSGVYAPKNAPEWARDRGALWNAAERAEDEHNKTRAKVAITGQHIEIALPHELTAEQNRYALQDFIRDNFTRHGYAVDLNIHGPDRDGDQRNIHAHLLITMRTLNEKGFSPVKLQMDRTELSKWVTHWRKGWEKTANRHLERHGHEARIDHRSLEAQGIDREASQHVGPKATQMERKGKASERGNENRATTTRNRRRCERLGELHRELSQVNGEIATEQAKSAQVYRMADAQAPTVGWWKTASNRAALNTPAPRFYASPRAERRDRWEQAAAKRLQGLRNWQALEREQQQRRFTEAAKLERGDAVKAFNTQQRHDLTNLLYKDQAEALAAELQRQQEKRERWDKPTPRRELHQHTYPPQGFKSWLVSLFTAKAATPAPTQAPARPLADAEPQKAPEESLRERLEEQEEEKQEENREHKGRARPPSPTEALEKLAQVRKAARTWREKEERRRTQEQERQPGRSIADDWLDGMLNKKDGPR